LLAEPTSLEVYNGTNGLLGGGSHLGPWSYKYQERYRH